MTIAAPALAAAMPLTVAPPGVRQKRRPAIVAALAFLAYFIWAGSSYDPRLADLWTTTPKNWNASDPTQTGWTLPAPGLFHLAIAGTLLFAALSVLAAHSRVARVTPKWMHVTSAAILLLVTALAHAEIYKLWRPFPLTPAILAANSFTPADAPWRALACWADLVTTALLMAVLWARKSPAGIWPAVLFAFHPLVLWNASNGSPINCLLPPIVFLAAMSPRLKRPVIDFLIISGIAVCMICFARTPGIAPGTTAFNGLAAQWLDTAGISRGPRVALLAGAELLLLAGIGALAMRARWNLPRAWGHMLLAWALLSPTVLPAHVVLIVALLPLAWTRAGWILSFTVLLSYAAVLLWLPGTQWQLPVWLVYLMFLPVLVVEVQELAAAVREHLADRRQAPATRS